MGIGMKGNVDGSGAIQVGGSDAITISTGLNATFVGTVTSPTGTLYPLVSGTAVASTSGTSIDFTGIPSYAKRITVMFSGVSTNGTSGFLVQLGTSGGIVLTGYSAASSSGATTVASTAYTAGLGIRSASAADICNGQIVITNVSGNIWVSSHTIGISSAAFIVGGGGITLSSALTTVRVATQNGTDTFDAGSVNILWE